MGISHWSKVKGQRVDGPAGADPIKSPEFHCISAAEWQLSQSPISEWDFTIISDELNYEDFQDTGLEWPECNEKDQTSCGALGDGRVGAGKAPREKVGACASARHPAAVVGARLFS